MYRKRLAPLTGLSLLTVVVLACGRGSEVSGTLPSSTTAPPAATATATTVPATTTTLAAYYEVQPGDTLSAIAGRFDVRLEDLVGINELSDPDHVEVGMMLQIPPATVLLNDVTTTVGSTTTIAAASSVAGTG